jgi:hypothetical protein
MLGSAGTYITNTFNPVPKERGNAPAGVTNAVWAKAYDDQEAMLNQFKRSTPP